MEAGRVADAQHRTKVGDKDGGLREPLQHAATDGYHDDDDCGGGCHCGYAIP